MKPLLPDKALYRGIGAAGTACTKLMRSGLQNLIVDNSDFKPSEFDRQFWSDPDSNDEIMLLITISICNQLKLIIFDIFGI